MTWEQTIDEYVAKGYEVKDGFNFPSKADFSDYPYHSGDDDYPVCPHCNDDWANSWCVYLVHQQTQDEIYIQHCDKCGGVYGNEEETNL